MTPDKSAVLPQPAAAVARPASEPLPGQLQSSAQILTFQPGLYAIDIQGLQSAAPGTGFSLPCARLDPIASAAGRAMVMALGEGGWLSISNKTIFVRVVDDAADLLLTTYRVPGKVPPPELRVREIRALSTIEISAPTSPSNGGNAGLGAENPENTPLTVLVHVEKQGDIVVGSGDWAGSPNRDCAIEGFCIQPRLQLSDLQLEYQAILGDQWQTPWFRGGEFCGSRGMSLSLLGFRVRLTGESAALFACSYWGSFPGSGDVGPLSGGQACESQGKPLVGIRIEIIPDIAQSVGAVAPNDGTASPKPTPRTSGRSPRKP